MKEGIETKIHGATSQREKRVWKYVCGCGCGSEFDYISNYFSGSIVNGTKPADQPKTRL